MSNNHAVLFTIICQTNKQKILSRSNLRGEGFVWFMVWGFIPAPWGRYSGGRHVWPWQQEYVAACPDLGKTGSRGRERGDVGMYLTLTFTPAHRFVSPRIKAG